MEKENKCPYEIQFLDIDEDACFNMIDQHGCGGSCNYEFLWDSQCQLLKETLLNQLNFKRYGEKTTEKETSDEIEIITSFLKNMYIDETNSIIVGHHTHLLDDINKLIFHNNAIFENIDTTYNGFNSNLFKINNDIYYINKEVYDNIRKIILDLSYYFKSNIISLKIGTSKNKQRKDGLLFIKTNWFWIITTGVSVSQDEIEEEQVQLSMKVQESRDFFQIVDFFDINWGLLKEKKDSTFQNLIFDLLYHRSSKIKIEPIGKSKAADRGRDYIYIETIDTFDGVKEIKWLVQCKCSNKSISPSSISGWGERVIEHHLDGYWLITNNDISPNLYDQFKDVESNQKYNIKTKYWERLQVEALINVYPSLYKKYFRKSEISEELIITVGDNVLGTGLQHDITIPLSEINYDDLREDLEKIEGKNILNFSMLPARLSEKVKEFIKENKNL